VPYELQYLGKYGMNYVIPLMMQANPWILWIIAGHAIWCTVQHIAYADHSKGALYPE